MKKYLFFISTMLFSLFLGFNSHAQKWESLFNGKDIKGWTEKGNTNWTVKNGVLIGKGENGHLYAAPEITDFEFKGKFKIYSTGKNANSGFYFRANPPKDNPESYPRGYEAQICNSQDAHTGNVLHHIRLWIQHQGLHRSNQTRNKKVSRLHIWVIH